MSTLFQRSALALMTAAAFAAAPALAAPAAPALPGNSVYQLAAPLQDQDGHPFQLAQRQGKPVIVSMFYNSCQFVCPMLIDTMRLTEQGLTDSERQNVGMLLITFDPARDDLKALKAISKERSLDPAHWTLARTDATSVRKIAAVLGIRYRLLASGEYNHTTVLVLLDGQGRVLGRTNKLGATDPKFVALVKKAVADS